MALALISSMLVGAFVVNNQRTTNSKMENFVTITNYNQVVQAERQIVEVLTNLNAETKAEISLLHQQNDFLLARLNQVSAVTNVFTKMGEFEQKLADIAGSTADPLRQQQATLLRVGTKVDALEKGLLKLSIAMQAPHSNQSEQANPQGSTTIELPQTPLIQPLPQGDPQ